MAAQAAGATCVSNLATVHVLNLAHWTSKPRGTLSILVAM
jgi:hypothetical protein